MAEIDLEEFHWLAAIVQGIDVGVVVLDRAYRVEVWNTFMENRSGLQPSQAYHRSFFELFPEVNEEWFRMKVESVATLGTPGFTVWEQRPYLVRFKNYQPITGREDFMYQNTTLLPLRSVNSEIGHICLVIYDVTDVAINRRQLQAVNAKLEGLSRIDRLTGLFNRDHWDECLRHEFARTQRYDSPLSLVMIDIDHFKAINDSFGYLAGDQVIQRLSELLREHIRDVDIAGRYSGEEFVVLLPDTGKDGGLVFAERLRTAVERLRVEHDGHVIPFTISLGVAQPTALCVDHHMLIEWADQALYSSKKAGRNQVSVYL